MKSLAAATLTGFLAGLILGLAGCAGKKSSIQGDTVQDQQGIANVATGSVTGLSYQSVLPMGMVILLTVIVLSQTASNSFEDLLLHRQQMARLKNGTTASHK